MDDFDESVSKNVAYISFSIVFLFCFICGIVLLLCLVHIVYNFFLINHQPEQTGKFKVNNVSVQNIILLHFRFLSHK